MHGGYHLHVKRRDLVERAVEAGAIIRLVAELARSAERDLRAILRGGHLHAHGFRSGESVEY